MNDFERLAELYSRINEQMAQKSEEQNELQEAFNKLKETFKIKIGGILDIWEKDIAEGKITDENTIQSIRGLREQYNNMLARK